MGGNGYVNPNWPQGDGLNWLHLSRGKRLSAGGRWG